MRHFFPVVFCGKFFSWRWNNEAMIFWLHFLTIFFQMIPVLLIFFWLFYSQKNYHVVVASPPLPLSVAIAHRQLPVTVACCCCQLPFAIVFRHCPDAIARQPLPIGRCLSAIACWPLPVGRSPSAVAHQPSPVGRCPLAGMFLLINFH